MKAMITGGGGRTTFFCLSKFVLDRASVAAVDRCFLHVRAHVSYMYEDINSVVLRFDLTLEIIDFNDVLFVSANCESILIVVDIYRMADADNRVILNVGGIRHETCMYEIINCIKNKIDSQFIFDI
jgi:hypothetical protein